MREEGEHDPAPETEDPVAFLKRMREESPNVLFLLTAKQARLLSKSYSEPYKKENVDEEFLTDMASYASSKRSVDMAEHQLRNRLLDPLKKSQELDVQTFERQKKTVKKVRKKNLIHSKIL